ncbi:MAG: hypothetical protein K6E44_04795 [Bacteroidales bacterium]|nr:hypothetical protein [Bacteroidales bacterium]
MALTLSFMKRHLLLFTLCFVFCHSLSAQNRILYSHDAAGNRILRQLGNNQGGINQSSYTLDSVLTQSISFIPMASAPSVGDSVAVPGDPLSTPSGMLAEIAFQDSIAATFPQIAARILSNYAVGAIPLEEGVTQMGGKTYSVTLPTAPGIDYAPAISLQYNSQGVNDVAGYGWRIGGVSSVTITNKNHHFNKEVVPANAESGLGGYALDGDPLLQNPEEFLSPNYDRMTFRGKVAMKAIISNSSVIGFNAAYPTGEKARFGTASNEPQMAIFPILESEDINGNKIQYEYYEDANFFGVEYYIKTIKYGLRSNGTAAGRIEFSYENRQDWHDLYYAGKKFQKKRLLKSIASFSSDTLLVRYALTHVLKEGVNLLKRIDCYSANGEQIPPVDFSYGTDDYTFPDTLKTVKSMYLGAYFNTPSNSNNLRFVRGKFTTGSFDDGLIIYPVLEASSLSDQEICILNYKRDRFSPKRFTPVGRTFYSGDGFISMDAVDIDGDGADEIVKLNSAVSGNDTQLTVTIYDFSESGANYTQRSFSIPISGSFYHGPWDALHYPRPIYLRWGDFDGKGRTSLLLLTAREFTMPNGSTKTFSDSHIRLIDLESESISVSQSHEIHEDEIERYFCTDINSDGRTELCIAAESGCSMDIYYRSFSQFLKQKTSTFSNSILASGGPRLADMNGDGYLDFVIPPEKGSNSTLWRILYNSGNAFYSEVHYYVSLQTSDEVYFMDINHDGLSDIVIKHDSTLSYAINNSGSFSFKSIPAFNDSFNFIECSIGDVAGISNVAIIRDNDLRILGYTHDASKLRLISRVTDSFGNTNTLGFKNMSSSEVYQVDTTRIYSTSDNIAKFALPVYLLSSEFAVSGNKRVKDIYYTYYDAAWGTTGLGFLGFGKTRIQDNIRNTTQINTYLPEKYGAIQSSVSKISYHSDGIFASQSFVYDNNVAQTVPSPRLSSTTSNDHLTGVHKETTYEYDERSFPVSVTAKSWTDNNTVNKLTEVSENTYDHRAEPNIYMLGQPAMTSVRKGREATITHTWEERTVFWRDSLMRPTRQKVFLGWRDDDIEAGDDEIIAEPASLGGLSLNGNLPPIPDPDDPGEPEVPNDTTSVIIPRINPDSLVALFGRAHNLISETNWTYSEKGKVLSEKTAKHGSTVFIGEEYTYDSDDRFVLTQKDALGKITYYQGYNRWGKPTTIIDPRNHLTHYSYDSWGETVSVQTPDGGQKTASTQWDNTIPNGLYKTTVHNTGSPDEVIFSDALGRDIRSGSKAFNGVWRFVDKEYRQNGQLLKESLPFRSADSILWKTTGFDAYGRLTDEYYPNNGHTTISYNGTSVRTVCDSLESVKTTDAWGRLISSEDAGGCISYILLDHDGPAKMIAPGGVATFFTYDTLGRRSHLTDPSAGEISDSWSHSSSGMTFHLTSNALGTTSVTEDQYGRTTSISHSDGNRSSFTYNAFGDLIKSATLDSQYDTLHVQRIQYDSYGRAYKTTETQYDGGQLAYTLTKELTYGPGSVTRTRSYSVNGVTLATEYYSYSNGHLVSIKLSDSTVVWSLDAENALGQPTREYSGSILKQSTYSNTGLPATKRMGSGSIQNTSYNFAGATGNMMSRTDVNRTLTESFTYDAISRLKTVGQDGIKYDNSGNIKKIDGVATMTYPDENHPYYIASAIPAGNDIVPGQTQSLTFTSFGRPKTISQGSWKADFNYGETDERTVMHLRDADSVIVMTRFYAQSGAYERDVTPTGSTTERLYIGGDAYTAPMALVKNSSGTTLYVIGRDVLGSITHLCTTSGNLVAEYSYDPWGRMRNPQTLSPFAPGQEPSLLLGRGWTGHEWLPWFGLVNANARLYDPYLARFLSPDPLIQSPDFSQNLNRYLYGYGNPLKYVDKNGKFFWIPIIIGAVIGAYSAGVAANKGDYNPFHWDWSSGKTWRYMLGGAVVGGLSGYAGGWAYSALAPQAAGGGFIAGAISGAGSGMASGFVSGFGMSIVQGANLWDSFQTGVSSAFWSGLGGGLLNGTIEGVKSIWNGDNFFYGASKSTMPLSPIEKGKLGEAMARDMVYSENGTIPGEQVTVDIDGTKVRLDMVADFDGQKVLIEVKNGPYAGFTHNQSIAYPRIYGDLPYLPKGSQIRDFLSLENFPKPMVPITPVGANALRVWGNSQYVYNYKFIIIRF